MPVTYPDKNEVFDFSIDYQRIIAQIYARLARGVPDAAMWIAEKNTTKFDIAQELEILDAELAK